MPAVAVYLVFPSSSALMAASLIDLGVSMSGSPAAMLITSRPWARRSDTSALSLSVADGLIPLHLFDILTAIPVSPHYCEIYYASFSSESAACSMMAHSMRFLNSSQPKAYTPSRLPVAWQALAAQPPAQYSMAQQLPQASCW